tara:strand:+ start:107 stop:466 length:360 start_codon:yes stop_codon:yes gene_type:complete
MIDILRRDVWETRARNLADIDNTVDRYFQGREEDGAVYEALSVQDTEVYIDYNKNLKRAMGCLIGGLATAILCQGNENLAYGILSATFVSNFALIARAGMQSVDNQYLNGQMAQLVRGK